jgi:hypothetical protein
MLKKNRIRLSIAVLLTTLICSHQTIADFSFWYYDCKIENLGACNTPLERYFQDLSSGVLKASKIIKIQLVNQNKFAVVFMSAYQGGQKNRNGQTTAVLSYHISY